MTETPLLQFAKAIAAAGLTPPKNVIADGALHRFASNGKAADDAGFYIVHDGAIPFGSFGCFRSGIKRRWHFDVGRRLTEDELRARFKTEIEDRKRRQEEHHSMRCVAGRRTSPRGYAWLLRFEASTIWPGRAGFPRRRRGPGGPWACRSCSSSPAEV